MPWELSLGDEEDESDPSPQTLHIHFHNQKAEKTTGQNLWYSGYSSVDTHHMSLPVRKLEQPQLIYLPPIP